MNKKAILLVPALFFAFISLGQETEGPQVVEDIFKGTRIVNGQSSKTLDKNMLNFVIGHRFGLISSGYNNFFGLDEYANYRLGVDYGITDHWMVGIGRSGFDKYHDIFTKYRFVQQQTGGGSPVEVSALFSSMIRGTEFTEDEKAIYDFSHRLNYAGQLMISRKFGEKLSMQLTPTLLHRNLTRLEDEESTTWGVGLAARYQVSYTVSVQGEYYWRGNAVEVEGLPSYNALGFSVNFETYSHVFSLHFTNATGLTERQFFAETSDDFFNNGIHFGFTIARVFVL